MPSGLEVLLGSLFGAVFGTPLMMGLFALLIFLIIGVVMKLTFEGFFISLFTLIMLLSLNGYLPLSFFYACLIGCAFIIYMALMRLINR